MDEIWLDWKIIGEKISDFTFPINDSTEKYLPSEYVIRTLKNLE
jgi:hypothetical protein